MTASTGKAATNINGTTLHSAVRLPMRKSFEKQSDEVFHKLRGKDNFLKILLVMNFSGLYGKRKYFIKETSKPFGGVFYTCWIIFYKYYYIYVIASRGCCTLFELKEIVYQSSDLEFVELLN